MGILGRFRSGFNRFLLPNVAIVRMPPGAPSAGMAPEAAFFQDAVNAPGQISFEEQRFLAAIVAGLEEPGPIIEIGTLFGRSTIAMAAAKSADRRLLTVDNYSWNPYGFLPKEHFAITSRVLEEACRDWNVVQVRADKDAFYASYLAEGQEPPAMVFLDADHSADATFADIEWAKAAGARLIVGHDYAPRCPGVLEAVNRAGGVRESGGSIWVLDYAPQPVRSRLDR